jgi:D-alanyl-D-alanine carboxypeptidase (penicillin-binding protein 5/6)
MNDRAAQLGCTHTHFHNPHGLNDDLHTVSAHDLAVIACEAMKYPLFREVVRIRKHLVTRSMNQEDRWLISHNKWLAVDKTADGIKTGFTVPAGHCYVGSATRKGFRVITVLMNSQNWQADHKALLDWAFKNYEQQVVAKAGDDMGLVDVAGGVTRQVRGTLGEDLKMLAAPGERLDVRRTLSVYRNLSAPIAAHAQIGDVVFSDGSGWVRRIPLLASDSVARASFVQAAGTGGRFFVIVLTCFVTAGYLLRRKKARLARRTYGYFRAR